MSEEALASSEPRTASQQQFATHTGAICTALQVHCTVRKGPMLSRHTCDMALTQPESDAFSHTLRSPTESRRTRKQCIQSSRVRT